MEQVFYNNINSAHSFSMSNQVFFYSLRTFLTNWKKSQTANVFLVESLLNDFSCVKAQALDSVLPFELQQT